MLLECAACLRGSIEGGGGYLLGGDGEQGNCGCDVMGERGIAWREREARTNTAKGERGTLSEPYELRARCCGVGAGQATARGGTPARPPSLRGRRDDGGRDK